MKSIFRIAVVAIGGLCLICSSCSKIDWLGGEKGYVSINGEKVASITNGYESDMENIGLGKGYWHLCTKSQKKGEINYDGLVATLRSDKDMKTGKLYPFSIMIVNIPGFDGVYIDGLNPTDDGSYYYRGYKKYLMTEGDEPQYIDYTVTVNQFSTNSSYSKLKADITIVTDSGLNIRLVFSGKTPNDGIEYALNAPL